MTDACLLPNIGEECELFILAFVQKPFSYFCTYLLSNMKFANTLTLWGGRGNAATERSSKEIELKRAIAFFSVRLSIMV